MITYVTNLFTTLDNCLREDSLYYYDNKELFDSQILPSVNYEKHSYYIEMIDYNTFYLYILDPEIAISYSDGFTNIYVNDTFTRCPTVVADIETVTRFEIKFDNNLYAYVINDVTNYQHLNVPECLLFRKSQVLEDYCYSYVNGTTLSVLNDIKNALVDDSGPGNIAFNVSSMKTFLEDENTEDVDTSFAKPSYDSTEFDFRVNTLFNHIRSAFLGNDPAVGTNINFPILNNNFTLNSKTLYNFLRYGSSQPNGNSNDAGRVVLNLVNNFWNFIVALYIFKDLSSIINDIRNGDLLNKSDTNIKTDML